MGDERYRNFRGVGYTEPLADWRKSFQPEPRTEPVKDDFDYSEYSDSTLREALRIWQAQWPAGTAGDIDLARRKKDAIRAEIARRNLETKP
jgi:hypothetical protein